MQSTKTQIKSEPHVVCSKWKAHGHLFVQISTICFNAVHLGLFFSGPKYSSPAVHYHVHSQRSIRAPWRSHPGRNTNKLLDSSWKWPRSHLNFFFNHHNISLVCLVAFQQAQSSTNPRKETMFDFWEWDTWCTKQNECKNDFLIIFK